MIEIKGISKTFPNGFKALNDVSVEIASGEFFALLGPSGCGKTTLLRMIAGFLYPEEGAIVIDGKDVSDIPPYKRPVNMVFQNYAVFPHMSVFDNVAYGLVIDKLPKAEIKKQVAEVLQMVQLEGLEKSMPSQLSGGQKQRVAVARALAKKPKALLLDEPLSALDAKLRESMRSELIKIQKRAGVTFVFVTHDQSEALSLSDRMAVMKGGEILQIGTPFEVYETPQTSFVANFIGSTNLLPATLGAGGLVKIDDVVGLDWRLPEEKWPAKFFVALRPEKVELALTEKATAGNIAIGGEVSEVVYLGEKIIVTVTLSNQTNQTSLRCSLSEVERKTLGAIKENQKVWCYWQEDDMRPLLA